MIHLQNKGIENSHIIAGLHEGVARNFKSTLINNRRLDDPVYFIGGYATNILAVKSFEKILNKKKPKYVYKLNRNFGLLCLNALPKRTQNWIIKKILIGRKK